MKNKINKQILFIARFVLTIALLVFIFKKVDFNAVGQVLYTANKIYILLALFLVCVHVFFKSYKWYLLAKELHSENTFWGAMRSYLRGTGLAIVTPSRIGELGRIVGMKGNKLHLGSLTFVDKISELWIVIFFVLLGGQRLLTGFNPIFIIIALAVILLFLYQFRRFNNAITRFVPFAFLKHLLRGFTLVSWPLSNIILILSFLTMSVYFLQAYLLLSAFHPVAVTTILMVFPLILLTNLVPITIGSLGIREGVAIYLLSQFGIPAGVAVSVSLILFLFDTVIPGVLGSLLFSLQSKSYVKKNR
ncbi:MAG: flippase-like domain-containing protein [Candidatus Omnitrophica bacterium]|nr:flippase-like domain-containing protein [Candidatus Omnitrophota bacterium]